MASSTPDPLLVGCVNFFNERHTLPTCIYFGHNYFDKWVFADGAYIGRADKKYRSQDGSLGVIKKYIREGPMSMLNRQGRQMAMEKHGMTYPELVKHFRPKPVKVIVPKGFWPTEVHKRNAMLAYVNEGDWHFYMDADWKAIWRQGIATRIAVKEAPDDLDSLFVSIVKPYGTFIDHKGEWGPKGEMAMPIAENPDFMAFRKRHGVHYAYNHFTLVDEDGTFVWDRKDWLRTRLGILYEELLRTDHKQRVDYKLKMFQKAFYVELSNGKGRFCCADCGYGTKIVKEANPEEIAGFLIPRGYPMACPKCHTGNLENPAFVGRWGEPVHPSKFAKTQVK